MYIHVQFDITFSNDIIGKLLPAKLFIQNIETIEKISYYKINSRKQYFRGISTRHCFPTFEFFSPFSGHDTSKCQ